MCVPNVSEGRDREVLDALAAAVRSVSAVRLFHHSADPHHHRSVFAYVGDPEGVLEASRRLTRVALERVDMRSHRGEHPRVGAVDVVPFVPVGDMPMEDAVAISRGYGRFVGELGVPVYYYEASARRPERRSLPHLRRGGYEGLARRLEGEAWRPDEGPARLHPTAGAVITGARGPLVAFNVNLATEDIETARAIARAVRESGGGLPHVRAIGVRTGGATQVAMNLVRPATTSPFRAYEAVRGEAERRGVGVVGTELVGAVGLDVVVGLVREALSCPALEAEQVIEAALLALARPDEEEPPTADSGAPHTLV